MSINKHQNTKVLIISILNLVEVPTLKDSRKQVISKSYVWFFPMNAND